MTSFENSPRLIKGGIVLVNPQTMQPVQNHPVPGGVIALQYNPESISRSFQASSVGGESQDRSSALRLSGPPIETISMEAEIDAADQLNKNNTLAAEHGIHPQIAALESILYPTTRQIENTRRLADSGTLEILPPQSPLTLFVFGKSRIVPVRIQELTVNEEAFDVALNPIRATVSLSMRVLNMNDLGFDHRGSDLFTRYQRDRESLAGKSFRSNFGNLGIEGLGL